MFSSPAFGNLGQTHKGGPEVRTDTHVHFFTRLWDSKQYAICTANFLCHVAPGIVLQTDLLCGDLYVESKEKTERREQ